MSSTSLPPEIPSVSRMVFLTKNELAFDRLQDLLGAEVQLERLSRRDDIDLLIQTPASLDVALLFIDFDAFGNGEVDTVEVARQAASLSQACLAAPLVAVGSLKQTQHALQAFRAGVKDFVDLDSGPELQRVVQELLARHATPPTVATPGKLFVMTGARVGVGVSSLAAHLSSLFHAQPPRQDRHGHSLLHLDLGWPLGDGQLYLNATSDFHFVEAVRNAHRVDETLLDTALGKGVERVPVLSLPRDLSEMRQVSHADSIRLIERLRTIYDCVLVDASGFANQDFVTALMRTASQVWVVTDQSVSALISLVELLETMQKQDVPIEQTRLIVNRYDASYGLSAKQIAQRHGVTALPTIPDRTASVMTALSQGRLVHELLPNDPYSKAVRKLAVQAFSLETGALQGERGGKGKIAQRMSQWLARLRS